MDPFQTGEWTTFRAAGPWTAFKYTGPEGSLTEGQDGRNVPDTLAQALGLSPWSGLVVPLPDFAFYGASPLADDPVSPAGAVVSAMVSTDADGDGLPGLVAAPFRSPETGGEPVVLLKNLVSRPVSQVNWHGVPS